MGEYTVIDEVFAPRESIILEYRGPDPMAAYRAVDALAKRLLEAKGTNTYEVDFRWDTTQDPRAFFVNAFYDKAFDKMSGWRVDFKFLGTQPTDPKKEGTLRLEIRAYLKTTYRPEGVHDTIISKLFWKAFLYFYQVVYYNQRRRRYLEYLRRRVNYIVNELRESLKIPVRPS
jgi:hypothetical protein